MAQFDTEIADGLWDGLLPADAPAWCGDVASLIGTARGPATEDELAGQDRIVALMAEAILAGAAEDASADDAPEGADTKPEDAPVDGTDAAVMRPTLNGTKLNGTKVNGTHLTPAPAEAALVESTTLAPVGAEATAGAEADATLVAQADAEVTAADEAKAEPERTTASEPEVKAEDDTAAPEGAGDRPVVSLVVSTDTAGGARGGAGPGARPAARADDGRPRHLKPRPDHSGRQRLVRRVVAVKAVATTTAVAIGITAAAAATGVVVTVVDPPRWPLSAAKDETTTSSTIEMPTVTLNLGIPAEPRSQPAPPEYSPTLQLACVLDFVCPDPVAVLGQEQVDAIRATTAAKTAADSATGASSLDGEADPSTTAGPTSTPVEPGPEDATTAATGDPAVTDPTTSSTAPEQPPTTPVSAPTTTGSTTTSTETPPTSPPVEPSAVASFSAPEA